MIPSFAGASTVFEIIDRVSGIDSFSYSFSANVEPYTYQVTLSDLSVEPEEGFRFLFLSLTSNGQLFGSSFGPGSFLFEADPRRTYNASLFGIGGGNSWTGEFRLKVEAVPLPNSILLLGTGILGLLFLKRNRN